MVSFLVIMIATGGGRCIVALPPCLKNCIRICMLCMQKGQARKALSDSRPVMTLNGFLGETLYRFWDLRCGVCGWWHWSVWRCSCRLVISRCGCWLFSCGGGNLLGWKCIGGVGHITVFLWRIRGKVNISEIVKWGCENGVARSPCFGDIITEKGCIQR